MDEPTRWMAEASAVIDADDPAAAAATTGTEALILAWATMTSATTDPRWRIDTEPDLDARAFRVLAAAKAELIRRGRFDEATALVQDCGPILRAATDEHDGRTRA